MYGNRRRIKSNRGKGLLRKRGERLERSFAHCYETGARRRTHLRGHGNILKRLLIHVGGFNLSLVMRKIFGLGKPRGLQGLVFDIFQTLLDLLYRPWWPHDSRDRFGNPLAGSIYCRPATRMRSA